MHGLIMSPKWRLRMDSNPVGFNPLCARPLQARPTLFHSRKFALRPVRCLQECEGNPTGPDPKGYANMYSKHGMHTQVQMTYALC